MKTIFQTLLLSAAFLLSFTKTHAQDMTTGDVKVTVLDETKQPMPGAAVVIVSGGSHIGGATNLDGNFTFRALTPGTYSIEAHMIGYKKYIKQGIVVNAGQTAYAEYDMQILVVGGDTTFTVYADAGPVDKNFSTIHNITAEQLKNSANGRSNMLSLIEGSNSDCSIGAGGQLVMRGSREGATTTYIDGEKVYGSMGIPGGSIEQVTVLSGGIPAAFGDMSGGVVIITTKSFETGFVAKQSMYDNAAEEEAAAKRAADEKAGKRKEDNDKIIELQTPVVPVPQAPVPADGGGN